MIEKRMSLMTAYGYGFLGGVMFFAAVLLSIGMYSRAHATEISGTTSAAVLRNHYFTFEPKEDITAFELAQAFKTIMPAIGCRKVMGCDMSGEIDRLSEGVKRHFVQQE